MTTAESNPSEFSYPWENRQSLPRVVFDDAFRLYFSPLEEATYGKLDEAAGHFEPFPESPATPVALRWYNNPVYGFSRWPALVYRRLRRFDDAITHGVDRLQAGPKSVVGQTIIDLGDQLGFEVLFEVDLDPGQSLRIRARNSDHWEIPNQLVIMTDSGWGRIRCAGIRYIECTGWGTIKKLYCLAQDLLANLSDWGEPIQVVGMPFKSEEVPQETYHSEVLQGYSPASMSGFDAAMNRLALAEVLQTPSPAYPGIIPDGLLPVIPADKFFNAVMFGAPSNEKDVLFSVIKACLSATDESNAAALQVLYRHKADLGGWRRNTATELSPGVTSLGVPVVSVAMMNVATDSLAATALGYGTIDIPQAVPKVDFGSAITGVAGSVDYPYDYMVVQNVAVYTKAGPIVYDYAALAEQRLLPQAPVNLKATRKAVHPPERMDDPYGETRKLSWASPVRPQAYGIVARRPKGWQILNRPNMSGVGYQPYVPNSPNPEKAPGAAAYYLDKYGQQPLPQITETTDYYVIGSDVFGRWSDWATTSYQTSPGLVEPPGLERVMFEQKSLVGSKVSGNLYIDFTWDWINRSCRAVRFNGRYYKPVNDEPKYDGVGLPLEEGAAMVPLTVEFGVGPGYAPSIKAGTGHAATVEEIVPEGEPLPAPIGTVEDLCANVHRYRVTVANMEFDFAGSDFAKSYAVWAVGNETVRPLVDSVAPDPYKISGPRQVTVYDPTPPSLSFVVPKIVWTTLPDATGKGRATLSWTGSSNATGYVIWHATETAVRQFITKTFPGVTPPAEDDDIVSRASTWEDIFDAMDVTSLDPVFARMNAGFAPLSWHEVQLSGATRILHFYRISATTKNNIESARSVPIKVAVPVHVVPAMPEPSFESKVERDVSGGVNVDKVLIRGITLRVRPHHTGPAPIGYRVFRARDRAATEKLAFMGPPVIRENDPRWTTAAEAGVTIHEVFDPLPAGWFPYYHRVQAVGAGAPPLGKIAGMSAATPGREVYVLPDGPPQVHVLPPLFNAAAQACNEVFAIYSLTTNVPLLMRSPVGDARIQVIDVTRNGDRKVLIDAVAHDRDAIPRFDGVMGPSEDVGVLEGLCGGGAKLMLVVVNELLSLRLFVPAAEIEQLAGNDDTAKIVRNQHILRVSDPLGRITQIALTQPPAPDQLSGDSY